MSKEIAEVIDLTEARFREVATSKIDYAAEKGFAMQILTSNSFLMKAAQNNSASLAQAITNVAAINLSLNPAKKEAYLLNRKIKIDGKFIDKICLEPSYMGLCKIATDSGAIEWVQAVVVYSNDTFVDHGPGLRPKHDFASFAKVEDRGDIVGVYCLAKTTKGDYLTETMRIDEVNDIMERSEAVKAYRKNNYGGGPWITDFVQQALKTVVRRAFKMWPKSDGMIDRMAEAVHISNENEGFEPLVSAPNLSEFTAEQKNYLDQLIESGDGLLMYVFAESFKADDANQGIWNNLYHSFEKGTKGKYQTVINTLVESGKNIFFDYISAIEENLGVDDSAIIELITELDSDTLKLIESRLNPEMIMDFNRLTTPH